MEVEVPTSLQNEEEKIQVDQLTELDTEIGSEQCVSSTEDSESQNKIVEGKAEILVPTSKNVFYNPVQEFNRDLSVAVLRLFAEENFTKQKLKRTSSGDIKIVQQESQNVEELEAGKYYEEGITILEALSATGLRSIRYAKEVPGIKNIVANDISYTAVESIKKNVEHNNVNDLVSTSHCDASLYMYQKKGSGFYFDAIDLDPYGCPSKFLDGSVQSVRDGGILLITCTDMAILCGNSPESCYVKYGAISLRNPACHEMALRIALQCVESHANRYGRYITPLLSFSADFYIRLIVRINTSPATCKKTTSKLSHILQCVGCKTFQLHPLGVIHKTEGKPPKFSIPQVPQITQCPHCRGKFVMGGPIWNGPLCDMEFVTKLLGRVSSKDWYDKFATGRRMTGMLALLSDEIQSAPLYYTIDALCSVVHCSTVPLTVFRSALLNAGYEVSLSHASRNSVKTTAPGNVVWDIVRTWVKTHPVSEKRLVEGSTAFVILSVPPGEINLNFHPAATLRSHILRYQSNPAPHWGPGTRSTTRLTQENMKSKANQSKKSNKKKVQDDIST